MIDKSKAITEKLEKTLWLNFMLFMRMANAVNTNISRPRNCRRQIHWPNAEVEGIEEWYRINVAIPFLDHIISELNTQFSSLAQTASR